MQIAAGIISVLLISGFFLGVGVFWCRWVDDRKAAMVRRNEERRQEIYASTGLLKPVDTPFRRTGRR